MKDTNGKKLGDEMVAGLTELRDTLKARTDETTPMKDVNTMTVDECRDELARNAGWGLPGDPGLLIDGTSVTLTKYWRYRYNKMLRNAIQDKQTEHPIPATLDAAANLPAGWMLDSVSYDITDQSWFASARKKVEYEGVNKLVRQWKTASVTPYSKDDEWIGAVDTELLARFRLLVIIERIERAKL